MIDRKEGWGEGISVKGKDKRPNGSFKAGALCGNGVCGGKSEMRLKPAQAVRTSVGACGGPLSSVGAMLSGIPLEYSRLIL